MPYIFLRKISCCLFWGFWANKKYLWFFAPNIKKASQFLFFLVFSPQKRCFCRIWQKNTSVKHIFAHEKTRENGWFFLRRQRRQFFPASYETPSNQSFQNCSPRCSKHSLPPGGEPLTSPPSGVGSGAHLWLVLSTHKRGHNHRLQT